MLRYEQAVGILRFYADTVDPTDMNAPYEASCTIIWETPDTIWLKGLSGKFNRKHLASIIEFGLDHNIKFLKSYRNSGNLPFATKTQGRYCEVDVELEKPRLLKFINRPPSL